MNVCRAASGCLHTPRRAAKSPTHTARRSAWSFVSALNQQFVHKAEHNPNERPGKKTAPNYRPPSIELPFQFRASTFARFLICQRLYVLRLFDRVHKRSKLVLVHDRQCDKFMIRSRQLKACRPTAREFFLIFRYRTNVRRAQVRCWSRHNTSGPSHEKFAHQAFCILHLPHPSECRPATTHPPAARRARTP